MRGILALYCRHFASALERSVENDKKVIDASWIDQSGLATIGPVFAP
ncbi:hypothetical protein P9250_14900 [Caballeronia sp. LP006]|nr:MULTISPECIES: hypothetical protein [unclassified Caballeronia]MDR5776070.1 hypothetical protein [Caballeronia sp. LZ002]MDR5800980.1 hypothetical protein [Caballeronia sp. LZ001]MDR5829173.1 hypothetical protein [Caballeronia sp. LP006]MDR5851510.1 hypothetical protein [Caballeronia sp. LZ003]